MDVKCFLGNTGVNAGFSSLHIMSICVLFFVFFLLVVFCLAREFAIGKQDERSSGQTG